MTVVWPQPHQALAAFRGGDREHALTIADAVLAADPNCADALLTRAMIRLAAGDLKTAMPDLEAAAALRSGHWLLEKLRVELMSRSTLQLGLDDAIALGGAVRGRLSTLGPPRSAGNRFAEPGMVNVLGTGFVRSFGGSACFLPITAGPDRSLLMLTDAAAEATTARMLAHLKRLDVDRPTILSLGCDPFFHVANTLKTRSESGAQITDSDLELMEVVAQRHRPLLAAARKSSRGLVMLLGAMPTQDDRINKLGRHLNRHLAGHCRDLGMPMLDWWIDYADPRNDRLAPQFMAGAYPGDFHLSLEAAQLFIPRLKKLGVIPPHVPSGVNYAWTHVFECMAVSGEKSRIWPEPEVAPAQAQKSEKLAAARVHTKLADLACATLIAAGPMSALYINVRDGFLPLALPDALISRSIALTRTDADLAMARAVTDFWGRTDIDLMRSTPETARAVALMDPTITFASTYPDTVIEDIDTINAVLAAGLKSQTMFIVLSDVAVAQRLQAPNYKVQARVPVGPPNGPAAWSGATVLLMARTS